MNFVKNILGYNDVSDISDDSDTDSVTAQLKVYEEVNKELKAEKKKLEDSLAKSEKEKDEAVTYCVKENRKLTKENTQFKKKCVVFRQRLAESREREKSLKTALKEEKVELRVLKVELFNTLVELKKTQLELEKTQQELIDELINQSPNNKKRKRQ